MTLADFPQLKRLLRSRRKAYKVGKVAALTMVELKKTIQRVPVK